MKDDELPKAPAGMLKAFASATCGGPRWQRHQFKLAHALKWWLEHSKESKTEASA